MKRDGTPAGMSSHPDFCYINFALSFTRIQLTEGGRWQAAICDCIICTTLLKVGKVYKRHIIFAYFQITDSLVWGAKTSD